MLIYLIARIMPMAVYFKYCRLSDGRKRSITFFIVGYLLSVTLATIFVYQLSAAAISQNDYSNPWDFCIGVLLFIMGLILGETCYSIGWIRWGRGLSRISLS